MFRHISEDDHRVEWVVEGILARSHRPGYPADWPSLETIQEWADAVLRMRIRSVVCVLDQPQLARYDSLNLNGGGLLGYYRALGLDVEHVPAEDYKTPPLSDEQLEAVWKAFHRLEKPVLVHCSAGRDRTGAAVEHILSLLQSSSL